MEKQPRGRIEIDTDRCKGCYLCVLSCPRGLITESNDYGDSGYRPAVFSDSAGACNACKMCAVICPDLAIAVYRNKLAN